MTGIVPPETLSDGSLKAFTKHKGLKKFHPGWIQSLAGGFKEILWYNGFTLNHLCGVNPEPFPPLWVLTTTQPGGSTESLLFQFHLKPIPEALNKSFYKGSPHNPSLVRVL